MHTEESREEKPAKGGSSESEWVPENDFIPLFRWSARVLGIIVAGFSLFMFLGETFDSRHASSHPVKLTAIVGLTLAGGYVAGMLLALRWERAGAILGGTCLGLLAVFLLVSGVPGARDRALAALWGSIVGLVFFLPVALYILCWWLEDRDRKRWRAGS